LGILFPPLKAGSSQKPEETKNMVLEANNSLKFFQEQNFSRLGRFLQDTA
jgi:hypothetical protein